MTRVSVVIVSHNRFTQLRESLEALGTEHQVIVVDNGSTENAAALETEFPAVRFIRLPKNFGLTKAMNLGLRSADGEFVLFLHDDTRIPAEAVSELANILEIHPEVGAVAPLLVDSYGHPTPQIRDSPPLEALRPVDASTGADVPSVSGAALMVRMFFLKAMRQIDEHYGNFGSDMDLCAQVHTRANKKVRIAQSVRAVHSPAPQTSALLTADREQAAAVYLGKYQGAAAGLKHRAASALSAIVTFRWGLAKYLLTGQKLDGTQ
ncbi:MAG: glycosyltransferase [Acidobacteriota bacterium]|nr:glycosyltransferase [Acidobacteriota bacterium]